MNIENICNRPKLRHDGRKKNQLKEKNIILGGS